MLGIVLAAEVANVLEHRICTGHQPEPSRIRLAIALMSGLICMDERRLLDMLFQRLMDGGQHRADTPLGFRDGSDRKGHTELLSQQTLDFAHTQMILPSQHRDIAYQPWPHLTVGCSVGQLALAERIAVSAVAVEYLVLSDLQRLRG